MRPAEAHVEREILNRFGSGFDTRDERANERVNGSTFSSVLR
jgi:hypothetical protein